MRNEAELVLTGATSTSLQICNTFFFHLYAHKALRGGDAGLHMPSNVLPPRLGLHPRPVDPPALKISVQGVNVDNLPCDMDDVDSDLANILERAVKCNPSPLEATIELQRESVTTRGQFEKDITAHMICLYLPCQGGVEYMASATSKLPLVQFFWCGRLLPEMCLGTYDIKEGNVKGGPILFRPKGKSDLAGCKPRLFSRMHIFIFLPRDIKPDTFKRTLSESG